MTQLRAYIVVCSKHRGLGVEVHCHHAALVCKQQRHPQQHLCRVWWWCTTYRCGSSCADVADADLLGVLCIAVGLQIRTGKPKELAYERS